MNELNDNEDYKKLNDKDQIEDNFNQEEDIERNGIKKETVSYGSLNQPDITVESDINVSLIFPFTSTYSNKHW